MRGARAHAVSRKTWNLSLLGTAGELLVYLGLHSERFPDDKLLTDRRVTAGHTDHEPSSSLLTVASCATLSSQPCKQN